MVVTPGRYFPRITKFNTRRRKRAGIVTKAKRRGKTRGAIRAQTIANAKIINRLDKIQRSHIVYTDYRNSGIAGGVNLVFSADSLINPSAMAPWGRKNFSAIGQQSCFLKKCTLNMYFQLPESSTASTWNVYLVRLTKQFSQLSLQQWLANPLWTDGEMYSNQTAYGKITLNHGMFRVFKHWYFTLTQDRIEMGATAVGAPTGYPSSTYRRIQVPIPVNYKVSNSIGNAWPALTPGNIPYHKQVYLLAVNQNGQQILNSFQWETQYLVTTTD